MQLICYCKFYAAKKGVLGNRSGLVGFYFVSTVLIDGAVMERYIEEQGKKDEGQTKFETS